jgi:leucyl aminopeptidase
MRLAAPVHRCVKARVKFSVLTKASSATPSVRFFTTAQRGILPGGISEPELSLKPGSRVFHHGEELLCVGLGDAGKVGADEVRLAAGAAAMAMKRSGRTRFNLLLADWPQFAAAAVEGVVLADYANEEFKTVRTRGLQQVNVVAAARQVGAVKKAAAVAQTLADSTNLARGVANRPGNVVFPETLAEEARWHAKKHGLRCTVLDERQLRARRFGGIAAVGGGSARPPRLIVLEHRGGPRTQAPLALVGKAVTFDTGGISIKPAADMEQMIWDKCGGAAVLGAMIAIAKLGVRRNVTGLIPSAENMPGPAAYRPGDIVTCYDGRHVEVVNTDAEGRMILADAIGYARKDLRAAAIVDIATLTGAVGVALGEAAAGLWSSDDRLRDAVLAASQKCGERLWPMPHFPEYDEAIRSEVALLKNSGGRMAGACTAAAFLRTFAEKTPWAHLDIAYMSHRNKDSASLARGATGFGVRTLAELAAQWP